MENKESNVITSKMVIEAMEQVRMGFTASRLALGAATLLYPLKKLNEQWGKRFTRIQESYHKFLLDVYKGFEEELARLQSEEARKRADETGDNPSGYKG